MSSARNSKSEDASSASSISISTALVGIHEKITEVQDTLNKIEEVNDKFKSFHEFKPDALEIDDLVALDRAHQHLSWLHVISSTLEKSKSANKDHDTLLQCHQILVEIVGHLMDSSCLNLRNYAVQSLVYIRSSVLPPLETELETDLQCLDFPKCVLGLEEEDAFKTKDASNVKKFQRNFGLLQDLQLPEKILKQFELNNTDPALVVLKPLKKRFKFHFMGVKKTNNPDKPEWYLQQVGNWLKNSKKFFDALIAPVDTSGLSFERFSSGLCGQVIKKLQKDIVAVIYDDITLSHVIDEVLTFSQEFYHLGVEEDALPLLVLLEPVIFTKWLSLERKFAFAKIDDMMLDEQSWTSSPARQDISKCTETFAILLQSITNRFKYLNTECQLKFVHLQSDLLEDMRLRFAQIVRQEQSFPLSEKYCLILNSSHHLIDIMNGWSGIPLFLQLEVAKYGRLKRPQSASYIYLLFLERVRQ